jgi:hypothetical protein
MDRPLGEHSPRPLNFQRRERETVLGIDGIGGGFNPDNVQEGGDLADHREPPSCGCPFGRC